MDKTTGNNEAPDIFREEERPLQPPNILHKIALGWVLLCQAFFLTLAYGVYSDVSHLAADYSLPMLLNYLVESRMFIFIYIFMAAITGVIARRSGGWILSASSFYTFLLLFVFLSVRGSRPPGWVLYGISALAVFTIWLMGTRQVRLFYKVAASRRLLMYHALALLIGVLLVTAFGYHL